MKQTAFYRLHLEAGGKLIDFAGFEMPVQYTGILEEHKSVRTAVGVFDVSHMGEFIVSGPDAPALIQRVTTNDVSKLTYGKAQYSAMCYPDGGIVDDLLVYHLGDTFMLVVNASNIEKDFDWISSHATGLDVQLKNQSAEVSLLAVQGPRSAATLHKLTAVDLDKIPYYGFVRDKLSGVDMIISRTGYTGETGYELYFPADVAIGEKVWKAIFEAGKEFGIQPIGLGARDTLRLEMGFCLYGNDIDKTTNPLEAGLGWITKLEKGEFIASDVLKKVKSQGVARKLVAFTLEGERAIPRHGFEVFAAGCQVGRVTSGSISPTLDLPIGLAYVSAAYAAPDTPLEISVRGRMVPARVTKIPFLKK
jgi:aminomethyltransferase